MTSLEKASRRYILARVSPKQRDSEALYNKMIAELESIIHEANRHKIKKIMHTDKAEKLIKINAVKIEREKYLTVRYILKSDAKYEPRKVDGQKKYKCKMKQ